MNKSRCYTLFLILTTFCLSANPAFAQIAATKYGIQPLKVDESIYEADLKSPFGKPTPLTEAIGGEPAVIVFFQGSWSSECVNQLRELKKIEGKLIDLGLKVIAISPDRPGRTQELMKRLTPKFTLLSDSDLEAAEAFGVAYKVDVETVAKLKKSKIDLIQYANKTHKSLPLPSVFITDENGMVFFKFHDKDLTKRLDNNALIERAQAVIHKSGE